LSVLRYEDAHYPKLEAPLVAVAVPVEAAFLVKSILQPDKPFFANIGQIVI
jgi:hypothetical protein